MPEKERTERYEVKVIAPEGLGFGEGSISVEEQVKSGESDRSAIRAAIELVRTDQDVFVPVDSEADDDGCGDGRTCGKMIYRMLDPITKQIQVFKRSLRRAKLFGGGLIASSSMWRAVEGAPTRGQTLDGDRRFMAEQLKSHGVNFGAHTDEHAEGDKCGCGAIDRYDDITRNVNVYRPQIMQTLRLLYGDDYAENEGAINDVFDMYSQLQDEYLGDVTGRDTMDFIESEGAVVKQLEGKHLEDMVVLNDVEGTTLDQALLRQKLADQGLSPNIQAFVVDVWRGRMYADLVADVASERGIDRDVAFQRAYADFLIRTLAVSATLTKGDQPVISRSLKTDMALAV